MKFAKPGPLSGPCVVLEPLTRQHQEPLRDAAGDDQSIWTYFTTVRGADFDDWFDYSVERYANGELYPFAVRRRADDRIVGSTRYYDMAPEHLRLAIGSTWYTSSARGTLINSEVRLLTLTYAFETLSVNRVELITDPFNLSSRAAMKILGAVQEGVIRQHMIYDDGRVRDSVLFSIIKREWPGVRDKLLRKLGYTEDMINIKPFPTDCR
ncbi:GNAT family N-acetyltransferase [Streptosporangium sp. CA-115845]|uniref:GNAT family N-acetyltransferase n=1 Tax=Streptosporangium sp. CA-115845 TaxID=3240071 RepID=UPI003D8EE64E